MTWLNEHEVADAARQFEDHPVLGPATETLANLVEWTNANSDGWPYWNKPSKAAAKLQDLIAQARREAYSTDVVEVDLGQAHAAYRPVKSFLTRQGVLPSSILVPLPVAG